MGYLWIGNICVFTSFAFGSWHECWTLDPNITPLGLKLGPPNSFCLWTIHLPLFWAILSQINIFGSVVESCRAYHWTLWFAILLWVCLDFLKIHPCHSIDYLSLTYSSNVYYFFCMVLGFGRILQTYTIVWENVWI